MNLTGIIPPGPGGDIVIIHGIHGVHIPLIGVILFTGQVSVIMVVSLIHHTGVMEGIFTAETITMYDSVNTSGGHSLGDRRLLHGRLRHDLRLQAGRVHLPPA